MKLKVVGKHLLVWTVLWLFFIMGQIKLSHSFITWDSTMLVGWLAIIFYANRYWRRTQKGEKKTYRYKSIALVIFATAFEVFMEYAMQIKGAFGVTGNAEDWYTLFSVTIFSLYNLAAFFVSEFFSLQDENKKYQKEIQELREKRLTAQLDLLKSQIDPHFLFNALNTLYSMSYLNDKRTPEKIMQLSEMLRYVLYECNSSTVPLEKEVQYLNSYIDMNRIRGKYDQDVIFKVKGKTGNAEIAPMLLLPFMENAYKHSHIMRDKGAFIRAEISINGNELFYRVENSVPENKRKNITFTSSGIGMDNVKQRLNLLYPGAYNLDAVSEDFGYYTELTLKLK